MKKSNERNFSDVGLHELIEKTKFFECGICLQEFDSSNRVPKQICEKQHIMCSRCIDKKIFKKHESSAKDLCPFCAQKIFAKRSMKNQKQLLEYRTFMKMLVEREQQLRQITEERTKQVRKTELQLEMSKKTTMTLKRKQKQLENKVSQLSTQCAQYSKLLQRQRQKQEKMTQQIQKLQIKLKQNISGSASKIEDNPHVSRKPLRDQERTWKYYSNFLHPAHQTEMKTAKKQRNYGKYQSEDENADQLKKKELFQEAFERLPRLREQLQAKKEDLPGKLLIEKVKQIEDLEKLIDQYTDSQEQKIRLIQGTNKVKASKLINS